MKCTHSHELQSFMSVSSAKNRNRHKHNKRAVDRKQRLSQ